MQGHAGGGEMFVGDISTLLRQALDGRSFRKRIF